MGQTPIGKGPGFCNTHVLPKDKSAKTIIVQRVFNRLKDELDQFIEDLKDSLADDGTLYLFVMDHDKVQKWLQVLGGSVYPLAFGPNWKNSSTWIRDFKEQKTVIDLFFKHGFNFAGEFTEVEKISCPFPAWGLKFRKFMAYKPAHQYLEGFYNHPDKSDNVIADVGPGNFPFPEANVFIEHPDRDKNPRYSPEYIADKKVVFANIEKGTPFKDKEIDYIWASHILEHVNDPIAARDEICRIAKRGVVVVPSPYKDTFMFWDEPEHKWDIYK